MLFKIVRILYKEVTIWLSNLIQLSKSLLFFIYLISFGNSNDENDKYSDFQRRQLLNSILESKLYKTNGSP